MGDDIDRIDDMDFDEIGDNIAENEENSEIPDDIVVNNFVNMSDNQTCAEVAFNKLHKCEHDQARIEVLTDTVGELIKSMKNMQLIINNLKQK